VVVDLQKVYLRVYSINCVDRILISDEISDEYELLKKQELLIMQNSLMYDTWECSTWRVGSWKTKEE